MLNGEGGIIVTLLLLCWYGAGVWVLMLDVAVRISVDFKQASLHWVHVHRSALADDAIPVLLSNAYPRHSRGWWSLSYKPFACKQVGGFFWVGRTLFTGDWWMWNLCKTDLIIDYERLVSRCVTIATGARFYTLVLRLGCLLWFLNMGTYQTIRGGLQRGRFTYVEEPSFYWRSV